MKRRRGSILADSVMGVALVGAAIVGVARLQWLLARQQRDIDQRRVAREEVVNHLESLLAESWEQVTDERLRATVLSPAAASHLPGGAIACEFEPSTDESPAKRLTAEVTWTSSSGFRERVRLSAWKYLPEGTP